MGPATKLKRATQAGVDASKLDETVNAYRAMHDAGSADARKENYSDLVNKYYDLVTDFYEYGWGQSFHFASRHANETFNESIVRHEHWLALQLGLERGMRVVDVGCGVGGPLRNIARHSEAHVTGLNNNEYQVEKGIGYIADAGLADTCRMVKGDFMQMPFDESSFDAAYTIEATCHAPDKVGVYGEILRVLEPGAAFCGYEWCLTDEYDHSDARHRQLKKGIEEGDGLPDLESTHRVLEAMREAGFEDVRGEDRAQIPGIELPWYTALSSTDRSLRGLRRSTLGRTLTHAMVRVMERTRIAPKGSTEVSEMLNIAGDALLEGGQRNIFTPMFFFRGRKPG